MPHTKFSSNNERSLALRPLVALPLVVLLHACSADVVSLGENAEEPQAPPGSSCRESTTLTGNITVNNQEQLDALEGCEVIDGDLHVIAFAGADLRPLHALKVVEGGFGLFADTSIVNSAEAAAQQRLINAGWLTSLEGLESLERAGDLNLEGLAVTSLEPLQNLRELSNGYFQLLNCHNLRTLRGLEGLRGVTTFYLFSDSMESIAALQLPARMDDVFITGPKLVDLGQQSVSVIQYGLTLMDTALESLDGFPELFAVQGGVLVERNAHLKDLDGLNALGTAGALIVQNNPELTRLPELPSLVSLSTLMVYDNPKLTELPEFTGIDPALTNDPALTARDLLGYRPEKIEIVGNAELLRFVMPAGWQDGVHVAIENNTKLREVDFGRLQSIDLLSIKNNPALTEVELGALSRVDVLKVLENPSLEGSTFDTVQTFEREMSGNAAAP